MEAFEALDAEFLEAVDSLQLGIDLVVEDGIQPCMKEQGFDYIPRSRQSLAANLGMVGSEGDLSGVVGHLSSASWALESLFGSEASKLSDESEVRNAEILASLTAEEQNLWAFAKTQCAVKISEANPNPLASETNWFGLAVEEAASQTAASPEVVAAEAEFDRCFGAFGFGTFEEASDGNYVEIESLVERFRSGDLEEATTRAELESIAEVEREMSAAFETCDAPRREVVAGIYAAEMQEIVERDGDKAAIWAAEFRESIDKYIARLGEH